MFLNLRMRSKVISARETPRLPLQGQAVSRRWCLLQRQRLTMLALGLAVAALQPPAVGRVARAPVRPLDVQMAALKLEVKPRPPARLPGRHHSNLAVPLWLRGDAP